MEAPLLQIRFATLISVDKSRGLVEAPIVIISTESGTAFGVQLLGLFQSLETLPFHVYEVPAKTDCTFENIKKYKQDPKTSKKQEEIITILLKRNF